MPEVLEYVSYLLLELLLRPLKPTLVTGNIPLRPSPSRRETSHSAYDPSHCQLWGGPQGYDKGRQCSRNKGIPSKKWNLEEGSQPRRQH
jgi:hypothetical protein